MKTARSIFQNNRITLKAKYWTLCFLRACCCFGFHKSEASIIFEFHCGGKQKPHNV